MSSTTVAEFANELKKSTETLLEQLKSAGVAKSAASDVLTDADKHSLLNFLQSSHGTTGGERKNRLVAAGYNGFLPGTPHVSRIRAGHEQATVHAEQNAVADAARRGSSVEGCVAYVTHYPCINCAKILAASGIAQIKYRLDYHNDPLVKPLLEEAGVKILKL